MRHALATVPLIFLSLFWIGSYSYGFYHISSPGPFYFRLEVNPGAISFEGYYKGIRPSNVPETDLFRRKPPEYLEVAPGVIVSTAASRDTSFRWNRVSDPLGESVYINLPILALVALSTCPIILSVMSRRT